MSPGESLGYVAGPWGLLGGLFLLTAILGQLISNTATALIIAPMAVAAATDIGISARSVLMSITVAAAASFLTPVATPPESHGDGTRRISLRRLLEARVAVHGVVLRRGRLSRPAVLVVLVQRFVSPLQGDRATPLWLSLETKDTMSPKGPGSKNFHGCCTSFPRRWDL